MTGTTVINDYFFKNRNYLVCMEADELSGLTVSLEDSVTGEYWSGNFDAKYIENLTSKTGNFKQFNIFVAMLESALTQKSDAVVIELLTFMDLEKLHAKKTGGTFKDAGHKNLVANNKRYLILVYTVEFDRIHYPLPLNYQGSPNPVTLQSIIRKLRHENEELSSQLQNIALNKEFPSLQKKYEEVVQDNEDLKHQLSNLPAKDCVDQQNKEILTLKTVVKTLEQQLLSQKTRHQKIMLQLGDKHKEVLSELEDVKISERQLKQKANNLMTEIAVYKKCHLTTCPTVQTALAKRLIAQRVGPLPPRQKFSVYKWRPSTKCTNCNNYPLPKARYSNREMSTSMSIVKNGRRSASLERLPSDDIRSHSVDSKRSASLEWMTYDDIHRGGLPHKIGKSGILNLNNEEYVQLNPRGILKQKKVLNSRKSKKLVSSPRLCQIDGDQVYQDNGSNSGDSWQNLSEIESGGQNRGRSKSRQGLPIKALDENLKRLKKDRKSATKVNKLQPEPSVDEHNDMQRTLELSEIDARLNALQKLLEDNIS